MLLEVYHKKEQQTESNDISSGTSDSKWVSVRQVKEIAGLDPVFFGYDKVDLNLLNMPGHNQYCTGAMYYNNGSYFMVGWIHTRTEDSVNLYDYKLFRGRISGASLNMAYYTYTIVADTSPTSSSDMWIRQSPVIGNTDLLYIACKYGSNYRDLMFNTKTNSFVGPSTTSSTGTIAASENYIVIFTTSGKSPNYTLIIDVYNMSANRTSRLNILFKQNYTQFGSLNDVMYVLLDQGSDDYTPQLVRIDLASGTYTSSSISSFITFEFPIFGKEKTYFIPIDRNRKYGTKFAELDLASGSIDLHGATFSASISSINRYYVGRVGDLSYYFLQVSNDYATPNFALLTFWHSNFTWTYHTLDAHDCGSLSNMYFPEIINEKIYTNLQSQLLPFGYLSIDLVHYKILCAYPIGFGYRTYDTGNSRGLYHGSTYADPGGALSGGTDDTSYLTRFVISLENNDHDFFHYWAQQSYGEGFIVKGEPRYIYLAKE